MSASPRRPDHAGPASAARRAWSVKSKIIQGKNGHHLEADALLTTSNAGRPVGPYGPHSPRDAAVRSSSLSSSRAASPKRSSLRKSSEDRRYFNEHSTVVSGTTVAPGMKAYVNHFWPVTSPQTHAPSHVVDARPSDIADSVPVALPSPLHHTSCPCPEREVVTAQVDPTAGLTTLRIGSAIPTDTSSAKKSPRPARPAPAHTAHQTKPRTTHTAIPRLRFESIATTHSVAAPSKQVHLHSSDGDDLDDMDLFARVDMKYTAQDLADHGGDRKEASVSFGQNEEAVPSKPVIVVPAVPLVRIPTGLSFSRCVMKSDGTYAVSGQNKSARSSMNSARNGAEGVTLITLPTLRSPIESARRQGSGSTAVSPRAPSTARSGRQSIIDKEYAYLIGAAYASPRFICELPAAAQLRREHMAGGHSGNEQSRPESAVESQQQMSDEPTSLNGDASSSGSMDAQHESGALPTVTVPVFKPSRTAECIKLRMDDDGKPSLEHDADAVAMPTRKTSFNSASPVIRPATSSPAPKASALTYFNEAAHNKDIIAALEFHPKAVVSARGKWLPRTSVVNSASPRKQTYPNRPATAAVDISAAAAHHQTRPRSIRTRPPPSFMPTHAKI